MWSWQVRFSWRRPRACGSQEGLNLKPIDELGTGPRALRLCGHALGMLHGVYLEPGFLRKRIRAARALEGLLACMGADVALQLGEGHERGLW